jgi:hypothetical protein
MNGLKQVFAIGLLCVLSACGGGSGSSGSDDNSHLSSRCESTSCAENKDYQILAHGQDGDYTDSRSFVVVKSPDAFEKLWYDNGEWETLPNVDFSQQMVVAVFNGQTSSSGHDIDIIAVEKYQNELVIEVVLTKPANDGKCQYAAIVTRPYQLVTVERSEQNIQFRSYEEKVNSCD